MRKYLILGLISLLIYVPGTFAGVQCDKALAACDVVVAEQDRSITQLKKQVSTLEEQLKDSQKDPIVSPLVAFLAGVVVSGAVLVFTTRR